MRVMETSSKVGKRVRKTMKKIVNVLIWFWLFSVSSVVLAERQIIDVAEDLPNKFRLYEFIDYTLVDVATPISEVIAKDEWSVSNKMLNFSYTKDALFVRLSLTNSGPDEVNKIVSTDLPLLDMVDFYKGEQWLYQAGDRYPFSTRPIDSSYPAFPVSIQPNETSTYYIRVDTTAGMQVPLYLYEVERFYTSEKHLMMLLAGLLSASLLVCIMALVLGIGSKNRHLIDIFFIAASIMLFTFCYYMLPHRYFFDENMEASHIILVASVACFVWFINRFNKGLYNAQLAHPPESKTFDKGMNIVAVMIGLGYWLGGYELGVIFAYTGVVLVAYGCTFVYLPYRKQIPHGNIHLAIWAACGISASLAGLADMSVLSGPYYYHFNTVVWLIMLFAFTGLVYLSATADKNNRERTLAKLKDMTNQKMLRDKNIMLGQLVGGINHELNTPLTAIQLALEGVHEEIKDDKELSELVQSGLASSHEIEAIMKSLRQISKSDEDSNTLESFNFKEMINGVVNVGGISTNLEVDLSGIESNLMVQGWKKMLAQLFLNLYNNSVYATRDTTNAKITISAEKDSVDGVIKITWRDNGEGISTQHLSKVFDPFFSTKPVNKGTGLGLSNCQSIVNLHRGEISAKSKLGEGALFTLSLPALRDI